MGSYNVFGQAGERMKVLASVDVNTPGGVRQLRVVLGTLEEHSRGVDLLVVSEAGAYAGAYGTLGPWIPPFDKALSEHRLATRHYRAWLVGPIRDDLALHVLVFSPQYFENIATAYRYLFDALVQLVAGARDGDRLHRVAMPILLAGRGRFRLDETAPLLMRAAIHWLAAGLPFRCIDFVLPRDEEAALVAEWLNDEIRHFRERPSLRRPETRYDLFLSYAREDEPDAAYIASTLHEIRPGVRVFRDVGSINVGAMWQHDLYLALDASTRVVALLSSHYLNSAVCLEEFNLALMRGRQDRTDVLYPVLIEATPLYTYMQGRQYVDCSPHDRVRMAAMCRDLISRL